MHRSHGASRKGHRRNAGETGWPSDGALAQQRQSEVDREFARVLARSGGRITDSMEREMMQKALESDWSLPQ